MMIIDIAAFFAIYSWLREGEATIKTWFLNLIHLALNESAP